MRVSSVRGRADRQSEAEPRARGSIHLPQGGIVRGGQREQKATAQGNVKLKNR